MSNKIDKTETKLISYAPSYRNFVEIDTGTGDIKRESFVDNTGTNARLIRNGVATVLILEDGSKGVAKCMEGDEYSRKKGLKIAYTKAMIKHLKKQLKALSDEAS